MKIEVTEKYKKVIADEGYVITSYKEGDESYASCHTMYAPLDADLSPYYEITIEEDEKMEEKFNKENIIH